MTTVVTMTASSPATSHGWVIWSSPIADLPTNNDAMPNSMKTFHSSGTPSGIAVRITRWNTTMTAAAT